MALSSMLLQVTGRHSRHDVQLHTLIHMNRRDLFTLVSSALLPAFAVGKPSDPKSFEAQVKNGTGLLNKWISLKQGEDGLWQKQWLLVDSTKYDVVKSESALRPFVGTLRTTVLSMFTVNHASRSAAEADRTVEDAPDVPGGKNAYTLEYDLKFEPTDIGWLFLEGRARTSLQLMLGRDNWIELSASELREGGGMHGHIVRAFATAVPSTKNSSPPKRSVTRRDA